MSLRIYNTLTHSKDVFEPLEKGKVSMYICGPTVYDKAHIGHAMSSLVFDVVRRYLEFRAFDVTHVMNYTDVDDKIIIRANHEKRDAIGLAEEYIDEYMQHIEELNILPATVFPRATEEIEQIVDMTARLIDEDVAYEVEGDVYYRVEKKSDYGKLSGRKLDEMQAGSRIEVNKSKEHPMDFVLWKAAKEGEPSWKSPWGLGRPGWHIECSAMVLHHLGPQIDIHGGGNDLVFPHHENEIAQTESITGKEFARFWMHNGMLQLSGEKMSKSIGNLITVQEFLENNEAGVIRMMVLNTSYRHPLTYNDKVVEAARKGLERLRSGLRPAMPDAEGAPSNDVQSLAAAAGRLETQFIDAMDDDFNSSAVLALFFDLVRKINQLRDASAKNEELIDSQNILRKLSAVLGLQLDRENHEIDAKLLKDLFDRMDAEIKKGENTLADEKTETIINRLLEMRKQFRNEKKWAFSDSIRDELAELGVLVEDSAKGSSWRWK